MTRGGVTRGPEIRFLSPTPETGFIGSPLDIKLQFTAHGGAKIDRDSILITYKKLPPIDMTQRLKRFTTSQGIEVRAAELPPGVHRFRIEVSDSDGRTTTDFLIINVER